MNYLDIKHCNMVNGSGLRTVIWVAGCERKCPGCFSPYTHEFSAGVKYNKESQDELFRDSKEDWCSGITILGGEPLHDANIDEVINIVKTHKEQFPNKNIWIYTGYCWNELLEDPKKSEIIKYVDVICDGPFVESLKSIDLKWVGSSNQHVINVKERIQKISALSMVLKT